MDWYAAFRPRRSLVLPFLVVAVPVLYFVYRDAAMGGSADVSAFDAAHAGYAVVGLAAAYLLAVGVLALADASALADHSAVAGLALRPSDRTLAVLGVFVGTAALYLLATLVTTIPAWLDLVLAPLGIVAGLPLVAAYAAMTFVGNAVGREPSLAVQSAVVAASLAVTAAWLFALATGTAGLLESWLPARAGSR